MMARGSQCPKTLTTCWAIVACGVFLAGAVTAAVCGTYPIPFNSHPDWNGYAPTYPNGPQSVLLIANGLRYKNMLSVYEPLKKPIDEAQAARRAYYTVFVSNAHERWPSGGMYLVIDIYGPRDKLSGQMPFWGYIFEQDSKGRWRDRLVDPNELSKIEYLLFHHGFS